MEVFHGLVPLNEKRFDFILAKQRSQPTKGTQFRGKYFLKWSNYTIASKTTSASIGIITLVLHFALRWELSKNGEFQTIKCTVCSVFPVLQGFFGMCQAPIAFVTVSANV